MTSLSPFPILPVCSSPLFVHPVAFVPVCTVFAHLQAMFGFDCVWVIIVSGLLTRWDSAPFIIHRSFPAFVVATFLFAPFALSSFHLPADPSLSA